MGLIEFLADWNNFLHVLPTLLLGIFGAAIILERYQSVVRTYPLKNPSVFFERISELVLSGRTAEAISLCDRQKEKPLAQVVKQGLTRAHLPEGMIQHGLEYEVGEQSQRIKKRTGFLSMIANVATLCGLFGTILGLIQSFEAVGHADAQQKATILANGIATAMNATMIGLAVAIPCMVAYSFLMNSANRIIADLENGGVKTLEIIKQRYYVTETAPEAARATESPRKAA